MHVYRANFLIISIILDKNGKNGKKISKLYLSAIKRRKFKSYYIVDLTHRDEASWEMKPSKCFLIKLKKSFFSNFPIWIFIFQHKSISTEPCLKLENPYISAIKLREFQKLYIDLTHRDKPDANIITQKCSLIKLPVKFSNFQIWRFFTHGAKVWVLRPITLQNPISSA